MIQFPIDKLEEHIGAEGAFIANHHKEEMVKHRSHGLLGAGLIVMLFGWEGSQGNMCRCLCVGFAEKAIRDSTLEPDWEEYIKMVFREGLKV